MELLAKLYRINAHSGNEKMMTEFVAKCCGNIGAKTRIDENGNVFAVKGKSKTYPCIVAHLDQVQSHYPLDYKLKMEGDVVYAFSESAKGQQGLGADDKNGIWVALKALAKFDAIKVAFFVGEEVGCVGSRKADMSFFDDCRFVLQCDRKGNSDFITCATGTTLCSDEFAKAVCMSDFGYKTAYGMMTDVMTLKRRGLKVSACNISCGYYNAHSDSEVTVLSELKNCYDFVCSIIERCTDVYRHEYEEPKYERTTLTGSTYRNAYGNGSYYGYPYSASCGTQNIPFPDDENDALEDEVYCNIMEQLEWYPQMRFRQYWKYYGKEWGLTKKQTKEIFNIAKEDMRVMA